MLRLFLSFHAAIFSTLLSPDGLNMAAMPAGTFQTRRNIRDKEENELSISRKQNFP